MKLVITGGGTGGHIFAGVAIAQEFKNQSRSNEVLFIGASNGLETRLVPRAGFRLETLTLGKLVGQSPIKRLTTLFQIPVAVLKCIVLLRRFGAEMVVGVGGYAAGPCILAARILGIPTGVLEQNAIMGFTNRISAKLANQVFIAFEEIPSGVESTKCVVTGNPARSELKPTSVKQAKPFVLFVFGGSQGATGINRMMIEAAPLLKSDVQIIHQTGERDYEWVKKAYEEMGQAVEVHKFIDDMQSMYNRASLVVCRAGSGTISELGATKNAAVFIPFPAAAGNHQEYNARLVERAGAALVLLQKKDGRETHGSELANMVRQLMGDPSRLDQMRQNMAHFYKADAAHKIVEVMKVRAMGLGHSA